MSKKIQRSGTIPIGSTFGDLRLIEVASEERYTDGSLLYNLQCITCSRPFKLPYRRFKTGKLCCTPKVYKNATKERLEGRSFNQWTVTKEANSTYPCRWECISKCCDDIKLITTKRLKLHKTECKCQAEARHTSKLEKYKDFDFSAGGLNPNKYHKSTRWMIDYDYVNGRVSDITGESIPGLDAASREWLSRFSREYYYNSYDIDPSKRLHKGPEHIKEASQRSHSNRRDLMTIFNIGTLEGVDYLKEELEDMVETHLHWVKQLQIKRKEDVFNAKAG